MARFVHATEGLLGSTEVILKSRTVVAAYWPFASEATRRQLIDAANDVIATPIPIVLGLPASKFGSYHPLRYCAACHQDGLSRRGYFTWQLSQQLPGVWWCPQHKQTLEQVQKVRSVWRQPGSESLALGSPKSDAEVHALSLMQALSSTLASLERASPIGLGNAVIHRLRVIGLATSPARLNNAKLSIWLQSSPIYQWMLRQGSLVNLPANNWVVPLIRGRRRSHPLKWMIVWTCAWQATSVESAVQAFVKAAADTDPCGPSGQLTFWPDFAEEIDVPALPMDVEAAFLGATTMREVALELNASFGAVRQWLSDYPEFARQWLEGVRGKRLAQAKGSIEIVITAKPTISRSELLKVCKTDVAWLAQNSPSTLRSLLNRLPARLGPQVELFRI